MKRIWFYLRTFRRRHDSSSVTRPRRDGTYGWPR